MTIKADLSKWNNFTIIFDGKKIKAYSNEEKVTGIRKKRKWTSYIVKLTPCSITPIKKGAKK